LLVTAIYPAGEDPIPGIDSQRLAEAIRAHGHRNVRAVESFEAALDHLEDELQPGDLVLTLGAGGISTLGPRLLERLGRSST
jgi:UDP-N-acetylmuramate--alanine ligase